MPEPSETFQGCPVTNICSFPLRGNPNPVLLPQKAEQDSSLSCFPMAHRICGEKRKTNQKADMNIRHQETNKTLQDLIENLTPLAGNNEKQPTACFYFFSSVHPSSPSMHMYPRQCPQAAAIQIFFAGGCATCRSFQGLYTQEAISSS